MSMSIVGFMLFRFVIGATLAGVGLLILEVDLRAIPIWQGLLGAAVISFGLQMMPAVFNWTKEKVVKTAPESDKH